MTSMVLPECISGWRNPKDPWGFSTRKCVGRCHTRAGGVRVSLNLATSPAAGPTPQGPGTVRGLNTQDNPYRVPAAIT